MFTMLVRSKGRCAALTMLLLVISVLAAARASGQEPQRRWSEEKAWQWYNQQPWIVGFNFVTSTAVNDIEMWQANTFDPANIERELKIAASLGYNTARVFINFHLWEADAAGLKKRMKQYLALADKHGIRTVWCPFDYCNFTNPRRPPRVGKQGEPNGQHGGNWVESPWEEMARDAAKFPQLKRYILDIVGTFAQDKRVLMWDVYNEPAAPVWELTLACFDWAREARPSQPVTVGHQQHVEWRLAKQLFERSDIVTYHLYGRADETQRRIEEIRKLTKYPLICTEWLNTLPEGKTDIPTCLPIYKREKVGAICWGMMQGRLETPIHDILRRDGSAIYPGDVEVLRELTGAKESTAKLLMTVIANYNSTTGALDKARLLNGSVGGYEPMRNLNWLPEAYDNLAAIGFKVIRLDHLVNDKFYRVVGRDEAGKLRFDFGRLDRVIKPMVARGMTPLMCLSYCPNVLIPERGNDANVPRNMEEWKQIVRAYVQHYKDLGHTGWCWEVWNEPDIKSFFGGSAEQYVEMYVKSAEGVKEADPTAKVGGAADASVLSKTNRLLPLLDYIKAHPAVPLDFISYHKYGGSMLDEKPPYDLGWWFDEVGSLIKPRELPARDIYVTEWHLTPVMDAGPGADTDTHRAAAGVAARMYNALQHPGLTKVFYFSPIEGYRSPRIFNGDLGLLTINNHKKAVYNVFKMFTYLGDTMLKTEVGGLNTSGHATYALVTKEASTRKTAVLLWNYTDQKVSASVAVNNLPYRSDGKNIQVTQYQVDADHANYYKDYRAGLRGYKSGPTEELVPVERSVIASAGSFNRTVALAPFGVVEIILEPAGNDVMLGLLSIQQAKPELNLAAEKPVTANSSLEKPGWGTGRVVDEITHSLPGTLGWSSTGHDTPEHNEWVCLDLGQAVQVDTVKLYPRDDQEGEGGGFPVDFAVQGSDDMKNWTDLASKTGYGNGQPVLGVQTFGFNSGRCRYVRVYATRLGKVSAGSLGYGFQLAEIEVYGK